MTPYVEEDDIRGLTEILRDNHNTYNLSPSNLVGVANRIMQPEAHVQVIAPMVNTWETGRYRFNICVEVDSQFTANTQIFHLQGYTDHSEIVNRAGTDISRDAVFIINSVTTVNTNTVRTPTGNVRMATVASSEQLLGLHEAPTPIAGNISMDGLHSIRPMDITSSAQARVMFDSYEYSGTSSGYLDTRTKLSPDSKLSNRKNNLPTEYTAKLINSYNKANAIYDYSQGDEEVFSAINGNAREQMLTDNPVLRAIMNVKEGYGGSGRFTMGDLLKIDPMVMERINVITTGAARTISDSESFQGSDMMTLAATIIGNQLSSILATHGLNSIHLAAITGVDGLGNSILQITIHDAKSFANINLQQVCEIVKSRLETEVLNGITMNNMIPINLLIESYLFGDTYINLSLDGSPVVRYVVPTFADSSFSPMITDSQTSLTNTSETLDRVMQTVTSNEAYATDMSTTYRNVDLSDMYQQPDSQVQQSGSIPDV